VAAPEFAVQLGRTGSHGGWIDGLVVTYENASGTHTLTVPWQLGMCGSEPFDAGLLTCP
jgi:hypothetical protein